MDEVWQQHRSLLSHPDRDIDWTISMYRGLADGAVVGMYLMENERFCYVNSRFAQMLGYQPEEMLALSIFDVVPREECDRVLEQIRRTLYDEKGEVHYERKARRRDGTLIDVEIFGTRLALDGRNVVAGTLIDVTKRKQAEAASQMMSLVYLHSDEAMVVTDANGIIITANPAFTDITGYGLDEVVGRSMSLLSSGRHDKRFYQALWQSLLASGRWEGEIWNRRKNGEEYAERVSINTSYMPDGSVRYRVGVFSDITAKKRQDERIWQQAHYDYLTGLPNRLMLMQGLDAKIEYSRRTESSFALLYLDLDLFKEINDALGHAKGDELLRQTAQRMLQCVRQSDLVARLGGDEFCILASGLRDPQEARALCLQVIRVLAQPYELGEDRAQITASVGVALFPRDGNSAEELIQNADLAMYRSKENGRNGFNLFTPSLRKQATVRRQLYRDLPDALQAGQFELYYQPIVNLRTGQIVMAEALLRWHHPENGLLTPMQFMHEAEEIGLVASLGDWVFRQAAKQVALWRKKLDPDFRVSVNMSLAQFASHSLNPIDLLAVQVDMGLPGESMVVEITERVLCDGTSEIADKLLTLTDAGVHIALDDFGTGNSPMHAILTHHINYLKIDLSYISLVEKEPLYRRLCEATIVMAHALGLAVIAEGVTTFGQLEILKQNNCDYAQGFLFRTPVSAADFTDLLSSMRTYRLEP